MTSIFRFSDEEYLTHVELLEERLEELRHRGIDSRTLDGRIDRGWTLWSPERREDQRSLIHKLWDQHSALIPRQGKALWIAGVDGSGKSTLRQGPQHGLDADQYLLLDPTEIAEEMAKRGMIPTIAGFSPMEASALVHEEALEIAERLAQMAYRDKCNVLWEIPMNSTRSAQRIDALKAAGYLIDGVFADAPVDVARERALLRHRRSEEDYRNGNGFGGGYLPQSVSDSCRPDARPEDSQHDPAPAGTPVRKLVERYEAGLLDFGSLRAALLDRWHAREGIETDAADWVEIYRRCEGMPGDDDLFWVLSAEDRGLLVVEQTNELFAAIDNESHRTTNTQN